MAGESLLLVAGEASGDRLGESLVALTLQHGLRAVGSGGERMASAGLEALVPFQALGVSGFLDVLPLILSLRRHYGVLLCALREQACVGLVCVDYPGYNIRLMAEARHLGKPVFWVAPPQTWAWKSKRGKLFADQRVTVFFPFEQAAYDRDGAVAVRIEHPLVQACPAPALQVSAEAPDVWALLPGSRWPQAERNMAMFLRLGEELCRRASGTRCVLVAADAWTRDRLLARWGDRVDVCLPADRPGFWETVRGAVTTPGTGSLELGLRGIPALVTTRVDPMTYGLGRLWLKLPYLALPNLLAQDAWMRESIHVALPGFPSQAKLAVDAAWLAAQSLAVAKARALELRALLQGPSLADVYLDHLKQIPRS